MKKIFSILWCGLTLFAAYFSFSIGMTTNWEEFSFSDCVLIFLELSLLVSLVLGMIYLIIKYVFI